MQTRDSPFATAESTVEGENVLLHVWESDVHVPSTVIADRFGASSLHLWLDSATRQTLTALKSQNKTTTAAVKQPSKTTTSLSYQEEIS